MKDDDRLIAAEITGGIKAPTTYALLPEDLDALWTALRFRPLSRPQWLRFERYLTGPCAERFVAEYLNRNGSLSLPVILPEGVHQLRVHWTGLGGER
ncbi:hypothetical protein [Kitasatospora sp. NPDC047058]|uniref:hypothetical protein n=1 Tax=Kitasatospora sp. NPDC047058 TaxID=3155620 RepID=UPI0033F289F7